MKKLIIFIFLLINLSCAEFEFVYNDNQNLINPLYGKTNVETAGKDLVFMNSYISMFFGNNSENKYNLFINIEEEKVNRSVETNQATSNLEYELRFFYIVETIIEKCIVYEKEIISNFLIIPKASGYNYGTEASLEKKYELAITENLNRFVSFLSETDINNC